MPSTILVVDDDIEVQQLVKRSLERLDCQAAEVYSAKSFRPAEIRAVVRKGTNGA